MLTQHPFTHCFQVQIFGKYHPRVVAQSVSSFEVIILSGVTNLLVQPTNLLLKFQPIFRPFFLVLQSTLRGNKAGDLTPV